MLYSFDINNSCKYGYLTYTLDYYDIKDTKCETCGRTKQNIYLKYWPPKMTLEGGKKYPDFLNIVTPFVDRCGIVISERAFKAFQLEKISGFFAEPITVFDNPKNVKVESSVQIPNYYYCYVTGNISLDYLAMHYRKKNVCSECGQYTWSRQKIGESSLDYSTWDKSDICKLTDYPNVFICTQRVVDVIKRNKLKGVAIASEKDIFLPLKHQKIY